MYISIKKKVTLKSSPQKPELWLVYFKNYV